MTKAIAIVAALEREVALLIRGWRRVAHEHQGRSFTFFEDENAVLIAGGIGPQAARRAAEAVIALYQPAQIYSVGFAGALDASLRVGDIFTPSLILDARDGSRILLDGGVGTLISFMEVAGSAQKSKLSQAYAAHAVDMEAAAVAASATAHHLPLRAIKVISDEMNFEIPGGSRFITANGQFQTSSFVLYAALRPWLWPRVVTLARNSAQATRALSDHLRQTCLHPSLPATPVRQSALATGGRK
jgi:adenosylhomocysteine nucleosidase